MGYHTKQKERILDLLKTCAGEHLTVSDLGKQLEENGTPVGTATIYRYLEQLTEEGVLRKYILDGKSSACYQYLGEHATCQEHFHLKCLSCGTLFHVQCTFLDEMQAHIAAHHHFQLYILDMLPADFRLHKCNRKPDIQTFSYSFLLESY